MVYHTMAFGVYTVKFFCINDDNPPLPTAAAAVANLVQVKMNN